MLMTISFKYKKIDRPDPLNPAYAPAIPITLSGPKEVIDVVGVLDSGADFSAMPQDMAEVLGLDLTGKREPIGGIGGERDAVKSHVMLRVENRHETYAFRMSVFVVDGLEDDFPVLIGRVDFFDKFKIAFNEKKKTISLKRV